MMRLPILTMALMGAASLAAAQGGGALRPQERPAAFPAVVDVAKPEQVPQLLQVASGDGPLTDAEKTAFMAQVAACWNIGGLSKVAQRTVITVRFSLDRQGRPLRDSLTLVGADKDTPQTTKDAYAAARRAILRCGSTGYKLPLEKYERWKNIEMKIDPRGVVSR